MEYKIDSSGEKNMIKKLSIVIVFAVIIGVFLIFFNNITYIYKSNLNKISNKFIDSFCEEFDSLKETTNPFYSTTNIKYNDQMDLEIYINKNIGNEYDILKLNDKVEIYEKDGIYYLNIPEIKDTIQLNKEPIIESMDFINNIQSKDIKKIYKKISKSIINQLNSSDFYKVKYTYLNEKGKERTDYKYVLELNETRIKKILINAFNDILDEEKFLQKTDIVLQDITNDEKISFEEILEDIIKALKDYEVNENITYELSTINGGLFNLNIKEFKFICLDENIVVSEMNGIVEKDNINITSSNNITKGNCNITINTKKTDQGITINYIDSEGNTYDLIYNEVKQNNNNKNSFSYKQNGIEITTDISTLSEKEDKGILSFIDREETTDEDEEEKNDIEGIITINILEQQYKYEITSKLNKEDKKEDVYLNKIVKINNLTDEQLQLVGIYFELTGEQIRSIVGPIDVVNPDIPTFPGNIAIPSEPTEPSINPTTPDEPTVPVEPVKPPTNLAI